MTPTTRSIVHATLAAAFPAAPESVIKRAIDEVATAAVAVEVAAVTGTSTADATPAPAQRPAGDRPIVPPGEHTAEVLKAELRSIEWKRSDANPSGECASLRLKVGDNAFIFADVPTDWRTVREQLEASIGVGIDHLAAAVGRQCRVEIKHHDGRNGTKAVVAKWLPASTPAPAPTAPRGPSVIEGPGGGRRAKPVANDDDDGCIPF
jgi:hypothetical protein